MYKNFRNITVKKRGDILREILDTICESFCFYGIRLKNRTRKVIPDFNSDRRNTFFTYTGSGYTEWNTDKSI